ncbi:hypothetical protein MKZ20_21765 [Psychrobacillus sp. FSL K6-2684]|uniref:hypothetical protein n=1 Tax=unclassified Psychrobacillus TaxID=2636677 RepID=UPI0030FD0BB5
MCKNCKQKFIFYVAETTCVKEATKAFKEMFESYQLPNEVEIVEEKNTIGVTTFERHLESVEIQFIDEFEEYMRPQNKIYIYKSNMLIWNNSLVLVCIADRKPYQCLSFNYMPGRKVY